jgi:hypothetical protein
MKSGNAIYSYFYGKTSFYFSFELFSLCCNDGGLKVGDS